MLNKKTQDILLEILMSGELMTQEDRMETKIPLKDIYQQNLNFLIGSGASSGLFPTLSLPIKNSDKSGENETIETLATKLEAEGKLSHLALLFMYYFKEVIEPVLKFKLTDIDLSHSSEEHESESCNDCKKKMTVKNYDTFLESLVLVLAHKDKFRFCRIFFKRYKDPFFRRTYAARS